MSQVAYLSPGKREATKLANRQAILDAAREVFGELGYEATTVRDIIRRTGLSVGTFYNYYRSKEEVFAALADDGARRFRPILHDQSAKAHGLRDLPARRGARLFRLPRRRARRPGAAGRRRRAGSPTSRNTPEMVAVFEEVRDGDRRRHGPRARPPGRPRLPGRRLHRHRPRGRRADVAQRRPIDIGGGRRVRRPADPGRPAGACRAWSRRGPEPWPTHRPEARPAHGPGAAARRCCGCWLAAAWSIVGGRTLDPRLQFLASQARRAPPLEQRLAAGGPRRQRRHAGPDGRRPRAAACASSP